MEVLSISSLSISTAAKRAFQVKAKVAFNYLIQGVLPVLTIAFLYAWEEFGFSPEMKWIRWPGAVLVVVVLLFMDRKAGNRKLVTLYDRPGWGWTVVGLIVGGMLLRLIPLFQGQWANRQGYNLLLLCSNLFFLSGIVGLALGVYLTAKSTV